MSFSALPFHCAGRRTTPSGTTPSRTKCHKAISSLRAKATIIVLREPRAFSVRASIPLRQGTLLLELEKAPRQLDHPPAHPSVAGSGEPFLAAFAPALVGRAREARVARHGAPVAQVARQDLLHQHVRRLDADADHARQQADHGIWSGLGRPLETLQARLLDLPYLLEDEPPALHVAVQLGQRVGRDRLALGRAQVFQTLGAFLSFGLKLRMPSRAKAAFMRLMMRVRSPTRLSRSRLGRLASSSARVGIAAILQ